MKIKEVRVLRGPNFWSIKKHRLIQMLLDLEELEEKPTDKIPGFYERLEQLLPSLYEHECSEGHKGGFFSRVKDGTWMGHVIEHIALELQSLAGIDVRFGKTRGTGKKGEYFVVYSYGEEEAGRLAGREAVAIAETLINGGEYDLNKSVEAIRRLWIKQKLGPSTAAIVDEARKRNIPHIRLDDGSLVQLGYGCKQKRIDATITSSTGTIAVDIAGNKDLTKNLLTQAGIPVPYGAVISGVDHLREIVQSIGFPIVMKPLDGNHGNGATINITNWEDVAIAYHRVKKFSEKIIIEKFIEGNDYRVLVINNKFVAASLRTPACVKGDGVHTVRELIDITNNDPRRGDGHDNVLTRIEVDEMTEEVLAKNGFTLDSVLPMGRDCYLKPTANLSTGGTAKDVTDEVHPSNIAMFERIARIIGLDICGIDVMAPDLSTPLKENGGAVLEVNAAPGFRMHLEPSSGQPRNVAAPVIDMLFSGNGRIPIVAITGTNGKTTTTRLLAHIVQQSGFVTGYTTTDGIYINGELVADGDCSGPQSAELILRDPSVEFAVLETARGGMLRSGLAFDQCDAAIITNVAEDHLGLNGINTLEDLAMVKSVVAEAVAKTGYAILNADDDLVYAMKDRVDAKIALFSLYSDNARIEAHCNKGGLAAVYENGFLLLRIGNHIIPIEEARNVPATFNGKCEFNIANVLAATLAAYTNRIKLSTIRQALRSFTVSSENTPGRMNMFEFNNFTFLLDYAHNAHGLRALGKFIKTMSAPMKVGVITGVGDRRDEDIVAIGEEAARIFDHVIIRHDEDMRGRTVEEIERLVSEGIFKVDPEKPVTYSLGECESAVYALEHASPGALIVFLSDNIKKVTACIREYQAKEKQQAGLMQRAV